VLQDETLDEPAEPAPMRIFEVDVSRITTASLSFGDLIDIADATDLEPEDFEATLNGRKRGRDRLRLIVGFAWVIARRDEPTLTYEDVRAGQVTVIGKADPKGPRPTLVAPDESPA
jgi:hypothetical protein